jgi:hypothetical protein
MKDCFVVPPRNDDLSFESVIDSVVEGLLFVIYES